MLVVCQGFESEPTVLKHPEVAQRGHYLSKECIPLPIFDYFKPMVTNVMCLDVQALKLK